MPGNEFLRRASGASFRWQRAVYAKCSKQYSITGCTPEIVAESAEAGTAQASEVVSGGTVAESASTGNVSVSEVSMTDAPNDTENDGDDAAVTAGNITIHRDGSVTTPNLGRVK